MTIDGLTVNTEYFVQVTATTSDGDSQWSLPGAGATLDLALSVSSEQDAVTEGEVAVFIVTLSQETPVKFDVNTRGSETSARRHSRPSRCWTEPCGGCTYPPS